MRDDPSYLEDILEAIRRIEKYAARGRDEFNHDELIQSWIVHHIQIIGEAVGKLSESLKVKHSEVPWPVIKAMRNVLVHFYFGINLDKVWLVVENDIPVLKKQIETILVEIGRPPDPQP